VQWQIAAAAGAIEVRPLILSSPAWDEDGLAAVHGIEGLINVERLNFKGPLWFGQGIMDFFETAEFDDKAIILGRANRRMLNLRGGGWLPWDRFFRITDRRLSFARNGAFSSMRRSARCSCSTC